MSASQSKTIKIIFDQNQINEFFILNRKEEHFATKERELLAIIWAFKTFTHYLYGVREFNIYIAH